MSWLISLVVASLMFASNGRAPVSVNRNFTESKPNIEKTNALDETERFSQTYPLSANGRVSVSNVNGSITLDTWDRNEVKLPTTAVSLRLLKLKLIPEQIASAPKQITTSHSEPPEIL